MFCILARAFLVLFLAVTTSEDRIYTTYIIRLISFLNIYLTNPCSIAFRMEPFLHFNLQVVDALELALALCNVLVEDNLLTNRHVAL